MFVINPNQNWNSLADKLWLTVIPFFFNKGNTKWAFSSNASYMIWEIPIKNTLYPMLEERILESERYSISSSSNQRWESRMILDCQIQGKLKKLCVPMYFQNWTQDELKATLKVFKIKNNNLSYIQSFDLLKADKTNPQIQDMFFNITENSEIDLGDIVWIEIVVNSPWYNESKCDLVFENTRSSSNYIRRIPYFVFGQ